MAAPTASDLLADPLLRDVPVIEGFKVVNSVALFAKVGQGGMGVVYRGHHCVLEIDCAVKCLKPSLAAEDPMFVKRLLREARVAAKLNHQNIVRLFDAGYEGGLHHLVMEFVVGESVRGRVERRGPQGEQEALAILAGAAAGLAEAHRHGIVHRDVKPDNLLIGRDGRVKVVDLGLVKNDPLRGDSVSLASAVMGTPQYMAPEQWESADVEPAADVWALGATFWFLVTGQHAIEETSIGAVARRVQERDFPSLRERRPDLRPEVHALFESCVRRRAADRLRDAGAVLAALRPLLRGGEELLADELAGTSASSAAIATPPPRDTLGRIRHALETTTRIGQGDRRDRHEQQTIVSKGHTIPMDGPGEQGPEVPEPPKHPGVRWRAVLVALLVLVAIVLGYGWSDGWFDDPAQWDEAQKVIQVRLLVGSAEQKLADPAQLATVITQLRSAIELAPEHAKAKSMLAQALDTQAQQQAETDLDAAWVACQEAASLDASNTVVANHLAELRSRLQGRLMAGLTIVEPADGTVLAGPQFVVKGTAPPGVADVTVIVTDERTQRATRQFPARVVAGGFEVVVTAAEVGVTWVRVRATDRHGVEELQLPNIVAVAGVVGAAGTCPDPQGELRPVMTGAGLLFVPIPARRFRMGTPALAIGNFGDEPSHEVVLTAPFWLAESEVTRAQFALVMQATPWRKTGDSDEYTTGPHPATSIDWMMANEFCDRLTTFERKAGRLPEGYRYCLPTEAEWEGAARGGESSMFPHGGGVDLLSEYAVHLAEVSAPAPVKSKKPATPFRLFDMSGNVDEWCADHAEGEDQVSTPSTAQDGIEDPLCEQGENRIVRGGNFGSNPGDCRSAARRALPPTTANETLGFRPALVLR